MIYLSVNDFIIGNVEVIHENPTLMTESVNWKATALSRGMNRLKVTFDVVIGNDAEYRKFNAFLANCKGRYTPFYLDLGVDSKWANPFTHSANYTLNGDHGINVSHLTIAESDAPPAGSYFTIANETKIYTVLSVTNQKLEIWPSLRYAHGTGTVLNFINPHPLLRLDSDSYKSKVGERGITFQLSATEVME